jgi:thiamine pyrophosphokinase
VVNNPEAPVLGRYIGILPVGFPAKITTTGLRWDVEDWETSFGGQMSTSNMVREPEVTITTNADVIFTIDLDGGQDE